MRASEQGRLKCTIQLLVLITLWGQRSVVLFFCYGLKKKKKMQNVRFQFRALLPQQNSVPSVMELAQLSQAAFPKNGQ